MSFFGSFSEAKSIVHEIEVSNDVGHSKGKESSKIYSGHESPGVENRLASETLQPGRLRAGIKTPKTRVDKLTRKYASTGTTSGK